jgi:homoserine O-succinyltransferase
MGLILNKNLSAIQPLEAEGTRVYRKPFAEIEKQESLKIAILNLMPNKGETEVQLLRLLNIESQLVDVEFLYPETHRSKSIPESYLRSSYKTFSKIKDRKWDGLIITGAPVELMEFEKVNYWDELKNIMDWAAENVTSTFFICWGAQAALYHFYKVPKYRLAEKMFGVFEHKISQHSEIVKGFREAFPAPHSRHTEVRNKDIAAVSQLKIVSESDEAGIFIVADEKRKLFFVPGHSEYDLNTLGNEYFRDVKKGLAIKKPRNYFPGDDEMLPPVMKWRKYAILLFSNWLNYYVKPNTKNKITDLWTYNPAEVINSTAKALSLEFH